VGAKSKVACQLDRIKPEFGRQIVAVNMNVRGLVRLVTVEVEAIRAGSRADRVKILTLVVGRGLVILFFALAIGVAVALAFSRVISGLLFGISSLDLTSIVGASLLLTTVGLLGLLHSSPPGFQG